MTAGRRALVVWAILLACGQADDPAPDAPSAPATPPLPSRVVSLSPAASAFVLSLGAGATLIGVDRESGRLPELAQLPVVTLRDLRRLTPDLVLVPALVDETGSERERLRSAGSEVLEVAPRDFQEVFELYRSLGARLVGPVRARALEVELGRALAGLAADEFRGRRPRVAALVSLEPFELAAAHSFATDLIELAGGTSTSHDHTLESPPGSAAELAASAPDLVLVMSATPLTKGERERARALLVGLPRVEFFTLDSETFWARSAPDAVRRLRQRLEALAR